MVITARLPEGASCCAPAGRRRPGGAAARGAPPRPRARRAGCLRHPGGRGAQPCLPRRRAGVMREGRPALLMEAALPSDRARAVLLARLPDSAWAASFMDTRGRLAARTRNRCSRSARSRRPSSAAPRRARAACGSGRATRATRCSAASRCRARRAGTRPSASSATRWPRRCAARSAYGLLALVAVALSAGLAAYAFGRRIASPILGLAALSGGAARAGRLPPGGPARGQPGRPRAARRDRRGRAPQRELAGSERISAASSNFIRRCPGRPRRGKGIDAGERWLAFTGLSRRTRRRPMAVGAAPVGGGRRRRGLGARPGERRAAGRRAPAARGQRAVGLDAQPRPCRRAPDGAVERWYGTTESVEERRRAREAMRRGEERLRVGLEVAGVGLAEFDYEADTVTFGRRAAEILGLPADEALPRARLHALFHEEDRPALMDRVRRLLGPEGDGFLASDYRIRRPDGAVRWLNGRHRVEYAGEGAERRARRGVLALLDVTDRRGERAAARAQPGRAGGDLRRSAGGPVRARPGPALPAHQRPPGRDQRGAGGRACRPGVREIVPDLEAQAAAHVARVMETGEPLLDVEISGETRGPARRDPHLARKLASAARRAGAHLRGRRRGAGGHPRAERRGRHRRGLGAAATPWPTPCRG